MLNKIMLNCCLIRKIAQQCQCFILKKLSRITEIMTVFVFFTAKSIASLVIPIAVGSHNSYKCFVHYNFTSAVKNNGRHRLDFLLSQLYNACVFTVQGPLPLAPTRNFLLKLTNQNSTVTIPFGTA